VEEHFDMIASARVLRAKLFSGRSLADEGHVELQVHVIRTYIFSLYCHYCLDLLHGQDLLHGKLVTWRLAYRVPVVITLCPMDASISASAAS